MSQDREQAIKETAEAFGYDVWCAQQFPPAGSAFNFALVQRERVIQLERALRAALNRYDMADEGTLHVRDGVAWAMASDLRAALGDH